MKPGTLELYKKNCLSDKNCKPAPKFKKYESGAIFYVTQCDTCGASYGTPFSKKLIEDTSTVKPFDTESLERHLKEDDKEYNALFAINEKLRKIRNELKSEYFKTVLQLPFDNFSDSHSAYLNSTSWKIKRQSILTRDNFLCQFCKSELATQVHHLSYINLGNESDFELISVCSTCHQIIHNKLTIKVTCGIDLREEL